MDSALSELYQELILDHNARPHNFGSLENPTHHAHGMNPLCGDDIAIFLNIEEGGIKNIKFCGKGCAIAKASASLMTDLLLDKSFDEVELLYGKFHDLVTGGSAVEDEALGKLTVFGGVRQFPTRVKCATLAWHTLRAALKNQNQCVTTE